MSRKKIYPLIASTGRNMRIDKGECELCGWNGAGRIEVQITIFRGDDEVHKVCPRCSKKYPTQREMLPKLGYTLPEGWTGY